MHALDNYCINIYSDMQEQHHEATDCLIKLDRKPCLPFNLGLVINISNIKSMTVQWKFNKTSSSMTNVLSRTPSCHLHISRSMDHGISSLVGGIYIGHV